MSEILVNKMKIDEPMTVITTMSGYGSPGGAQAFKLSPGMETKAGMLENLGMQPDRL
jgi:hypothetical protein